jgi:membrane protease YdiL (CAAX protease family)
LRSSAGLLTFALVFFLEFNFLQDHVAGFSDTSVQVSPIFALLREGLLLGAVLLPTVLLGIAERRSPLAYGLRGARGLGRFAVGLVWGISSASVLVFCLWVSGHLVFDHVRLSAGPAVGFAVAWGACFLVVALVEEMLFRGYLQSTLTRLIGFWPAAAVLSAIFGIVHLRNSNEMAFGVAVVVLGGAFFSLALRRTGSLWWGIGFHTAWDWSQSFLFGTPDSGILVADRLMQTHAQGTVMWSGGATGPEGSVPMRRCRAREFSCQPSPPAHCYGRRTALGEPRGVLLRRFLAYGADPRSVAATVDAVAAVLGQRWAHEPVLSSSRLGNPGRDA